MRYVAVLLAGVVIGWVFGIWTYAEANLRLDGQRRLAQGRVRYWRWLV